MSGSGVSPLSIKETEKSFKSSRLNAAFNSHAERIPAQKKRRKSTNLSTRTRRCSHDQKHTPVFTPYNPLQSRHVSTSVRPLAVESGQLSPCGNCQEAFGEHRKSLNGMESDEERLFFIYTSRKAQNRGSVLWKQLSPSHVKQTSGRTLGDSPLAVNP